MYVPIILCNKDIHHFRTISELAFLASLPHCVQSLMSGRAGWWTAATQCARRSGIRTRTGHAMPWHLEGGEKEGGAHRCSLVAPLVPCVERGGGRSGGTFRRSGVCLMVPAFFVRRLPCTTPLFHPGCGLWAVFCVDPSRRNMYGS